MTIRILGRSLLSASLLLMPVVAAAQPLDILGCIPKESEAVSPTDSLDCQWKNGELSATLAQLYIEGWRMTATAFYDDTKQVIYLERPVPAPP